MSLIRFAARSLLASYFVVEGVHALRHPEATAETVRPVAERVLPLASKVLPAQAAARLPATAVDLARACGIARIAGGVALATGFGRRAGAAVLGVSLLPQLATSRPRRSTEPSAFGRDLALLGGLTLAALDTEGRPSLKWRARAIGQIARQQKAKAEVLAQRQAKKAVIEARKAARRTARPLRRAIEAAS